MHLSSPMLKQKHDATIPNNERKSSDHVNRWKTNIKTIFRIQNTEIITEIGFAVFTIFIDRNAAINTAVGAGKAI